VLVVDMENDFGAKGGMFDRAGIDISLIQQAVAPTAKVLAAARQAGLPIIYLKMGYREDLSDLGREGSPNRVQHLQYMHVGDTMTAPNGTMSRILIRDNWGTDILPALKEQPGEVVLYKTRFSGFYQTALDATLQGLGIQTLLVTGCTTSVCVESTVRDAMFRDYQAIVLADCTAEPIGQGLPRSNHEVSLSLMQQLFGWVTHSRDVLQALATQPQPRTAKAK
jgi:ureidoacrylate peracid hydrolase